MVAQEHRPDRLEHPDGQVERDARGERRLDRRTREQRAERASAGLGRDVRGEVEAPREHVDADEHHREEHEGCTDAQCLGHHRRDQGTEHEPRHVEGGEAPEVGSHRLRVAGDDDAPHRGSDGAAAEAEQEPSHEERPELGGECAPDHRPHRQQDPALHEQRRVTAVGQTGERELGDEAGEEARGHDVAELGLGEPVTVAEVCEQGVDRAVAERHAPGHDAVREQPRPLRPPSTLPKPSSHSPSLHAHHPYPQLRRVTHVVTPFPTTVSAPVVPPVSARRPPRRARRVVPRRVENSAALWADEPVGFDSNASARAGPSSNRCRACQRHRATSHSSVSPRAQVDEVAHRRMHAGLGDHRTAVGVAQQDARRRRSVDHLTHRRDVGLVPLTRRHRPCVTSHRRAVRHVQAPRPCHAPSPYTSPLLTIAQPTHPPSAVELRTGFLEDLRTGIAARGAMGSRWSSRVMWMSWSWVRWSGERRSKKWRRTLSTCIGAAASSARSLGR